MADQDRSELTSTGKSGSHSFCSVPRCSSSARKEKAVHFHSFPTEKSMKKRWIVAIRRDEGPLFKIKKGSTFVCSKHFRPGDYKWSVLRKTLKKESIPSVFPAWQSQKPRRKSPKKRAYDMTCSSGSSTGEVVKSEPSAQNISQTQKNLQNLDYK